MKAFIPEIGSKLRLNKDWTFRLYFEPRNESITHKADDTKQLSSYFIFDPENSYYERTLPKGSEFIVDRIYVRQGLKEFSSVTMKIHNTTDQNILNAGKRKIGFSKEKTYGRFWVKLIDFNNAEFEIVEDGAKRMNKPNKKVKGKVLTFQEFRRKKQYPEYWVEFQHDTDPELSFNGLVQTRPSCVATLSDYDWMGNKVPQEDFDDFYNNPFYEYSEDMSYAEKGFGSSSCLTNRYYDNKCYVFIPKFYVQSLIPEEWYERNKNNNRFLYFNYKMYIPIHPLKEHIHIPKDKNKRKEFGIQSKTELRNIPIAGGKLTIYGVDEVEQEE